MIQQNINQILSLSSLLMSQNPIVQQLGKESAAKRQLGFEKEKHAQKTAALRQAMAQDATEAREILKDPNATQQQKEAAQDTLDAFSNIREAHAAEGEELERREFELNPTAEGAESILDREVGEVFEANEAKRETARQEAQRKQEAQRQEENTRAEKARQAREKAAADLEARREEIRSTLLQGMP